MSDTPNFGIAERVARLDAEGIHLKQNREEIQFCYSAVAPTFPACIVEVGSMAGASLYVYAGLLGERGTAIAIDDGGRSPKTRSHLKRVIQMLKEDGLDAEWMRGNSHQPETVDRLRERLREKRFVPTGGTTDSNAPIDFLHIDGDHSAAGSFADWKDYGPLVRPGGIVAFHDIRATPPCHVDETWRTICDGGHLTRAIACGRFRSREGGKLHKECGIGLVYIE